MQFLKIGDMDIQKIFLDVNAIVSEALVLCIEKSIQTIPILEKGKVIGVFSLRQFTSKSHGFYDPRDSIMPYISQHFDIVEPEAEILNIAGFEDSELLVVDKKEGFLGIVRLKDVLIMVIEMLNNNTDELGAILEASYNAIIAIDENGRITHVNPSAKRILRIFDDCRGKYIKDVLPETRLLDVLRREGWT